VLTEVREQPRAAIAKSGKEVGEIVETYEEARGVAG
jgi:hypothetical protein